MQLRSETGSDSKQMQLEPSQHGAKERRPSFANVHENLKRSSWTPTIDKESMDVAHSLLQLKFDPNHRHATQLDDAKSNSAWSLNCPSSQTDGKSITPCSLCSDGIRLSSAHCCNADNAGCTALQRLSAPTELDSKLAPVCDIHGLLMPKNLLDLILKDNHGADTRKRHLPAPRRAVLLQTPAIGRNGNQKFWVARAVVTLTSQGRSADVHSAFSRIDWKRARSSGTPPRQSFVWRMTDVTPLKPPLYIPRQFGPVTWIKFSEAQLAAIQRAVSKAKLKLSPVAHDY